MSNTIKVTYGQETMHLKNVLLGGRIDDYHEQPTSFYGGVLDLDEIHNSLHHIIRAVIKMLTSEFEIPLEEVDDFVLSALAEAITKEWNVIHSGHSDVDIQKITKSNNHN
jgi:hypothetical protein